MTNNALSAAALTAALAISSQALARAPAPLVPTALVEDVKSASADVEFMDYVGTGQVIKLEPSDVLVLSYLKSCEHETITGGTVRVGSDKSEVEGGKIVRIKVLCNGRNMKLTPRRPTPAPHRRSACRTRRSNRPSTRCRRSSRFPRLAPVRVAPSSSNARTVPASASRSSSTSL
jgi:hypothetical protein